jgi:hypothetical protein
MKLRGLLGFDDPGFGVVNHTDQGSDDIGVCSVQIPGCFYLDVLAFYGKLEPNLGFGSFALRNGELVDEGVLISTSASCFGNIGTDRTG